MKFNSTLPIALALGVTLGAGLAQAQTKKELAAKIVTLQQPAIENLARGLAERPAQSMLNQAGMALQARVPADKREAIAKDIQADVKKYLDETVPLLRDRALKLAPTTIQPMLEDKFTEDELKQVIVMLESPAIRKYQQAAGDMEQALGDKLVGETRATIEPKLSALEQSIAKRPRHHAAARRRRFRTDQCARQACRQAGRPLPRSKRRGLPVSVIPDHRPYNFSAGPAVLPESVLRQAAAEMLDWHGSGMSVMEMSHRGKEFISIAAAAEALLRELLAVPTNFRILFVQGGGAG